MILGGKGTCAYALIDKAIRLLKPRPIQCARCEDTSVYSWLVAICRVFFSLVSRARLDATSFAAIAFSLDAQVRVYVFYLRN